MLGSLLANELFDFINSLSAYDTNEKVMVITPGNGLFLKKFLCKYVVREIVKINSQFLKIASFALTFL